MWLCCCQVPIDICEQRDPKGLYKKARAGLVKGFTGGLLGWGVQARLLVRVGHMLGGTRSTTLTDGCPGLAVAPRPRASTLSRSAQLLSCEPDARNMNMQVSAHTQQPLLVPLLRPWCGCCVRRHRRPV